MLPDRTIGSIRFASSKEQYQDILRGILSRNIERPVDLNPTIVTIGSGITDSQAFLESSQRFIP